MTSSNPSSSSTTLFTPKPKRYAPKVQPCPFPPLNLNKAGKCHRCHFQGEISGNSVLVRKKEQGRALFRMGCYGKGMLTRHEPWINEEINSFPMPQRDPCHDKIKIIAPQEEMEKNAEKSTFSFFKNPPQEKKQQALTKHCVEASDKIQWEFTEEDWIEMFKSDIGNCDRPSDMVVSDNNTDDDMRSDNGINWSGNSPQKSQENFAEQKSSNDFNLSDAGKTHDTRQYNMGVPNHFYVLPGCPIELNTEVELPNISTDRRSADGEVGTGCSHKTFGDTCNNEMITHRNSDSHEMNSCSITTGQDVSIYKNIPACVNGDDCLKLSCVEAFFLCFGLGLLTVVNAEQEPLTIDQLWTRFCHEGNNFPFLYAVYHHFRSKGWVVRSGLKFGVDYLLYKHGPAFYHACYSVVVVGDGTQSERNIMRSWRTLSTLERITSQVRKDLLICRVRIDEGSMDLSSPRCLVGADIDEILIRRWIPSEERVSLP